MKSKLAILGGEPLINKKFKPYNSIGVEEAKAVQEVMETGVLSKYLGCWHDDFYGGPKVQEFERMCEVYFNVKHAITVNSWSSGLSAAVGALDIEPGDVILTGRFKNKRQVVKKIGTDDLGQPTINGMKALSFRIEKLMPKDKWSKESKEEAEETKGKDK